MSYPQGGTSGISASTTAEPVQVFIRIRPEPQDSNFNFGDGKLDARKSTSQGSSGRAFINASETSSNNGRASMAKMISAMGSGDVGGTNSASLIKCIQQRDAFTLQVVTPETASAAMRKSSAAVDDKVFTFDRIFAEDSTQEAVYESVSAHVKATVKGYNATIFAYGSTGSGKSYTMTGTSSTPGIIPRAISEIFSIIEMTAAEEQDVFFYVRLSYVELYNNSFRNLLEFASKELGREKEAKDREKDRQVRSSADLDEDGDIPGLGGTASPSLSHTITNRGDRIEVRESSAAGVFLAGPNIRIPVTTAHEAFQLVAKGNKTRAVGCTNCNDFSSRSHAILTLHVESRVLNYDKNSTRGPESATAAASELRLGKMHLVDLAGSERVKLSGAEGDTLIESQNINLSLSALGDVLSALSRNAMILSQEEKVFATGKKANLLVPVPYRNSKLTHLLKDSLGGNSKTIMIATVRTHAEYYQQTAVSLMYAARAKKVRNKSLVNRNVIGDTGIHAITSEIERLRNRLDERSSEFTRLRDAQLKDAQENSVLRARLTELHRANEAEKKQLESQMSHIIHSQAGQLASQTQKINMLQKSLQEELALSQNRIAEQEREIKWLKKALDESAITANQPIEMLERMQKVVDALQEQAHCQKQQIECSNNQIISLKADLEEVTSSLSQCQIENKALLTGKEYAENELDQKKRELAHVQIKFRNSEASLRTSIGDFDKLQAIRLSDLEKAAERIHDLERERNVLHDKLTTTVSSLEKQMAGALGEAAVCIDQAESNSQKAVARAIASDNDANDLRSHLALARDALDEMKSINGDLVNDIKDLTRQLHEDRNALDLSSARCKELEVTVHELSETLRTLNASFLDATTTIESHRNSYESELSAKDLEIASQKRSMDDLRKHYDHCLASMKEKTTNTIKNLREETVGLQMQIAQLGDSHLQEMETLQRICLEGEDSFKRQLGHSHIAEIESVKSMYMEKIKLMDIGHNQALIEQRFEQDRLFTQSQEDNKAKIMNLEKGADKMHQQLVKDLEDTWMAKLEVAENEHMASIKNLSDEMKRLREEELSTLRSLLEDEKRKAFEILQSQYASAVIDLRAANTALVALNNTHVSELQAFKEASVALEKHAALEIDRLAEEKAIVIAQLHDQQLQHQRDIKAMSVAHTQEVVHITAKADKKIKAKVAEEKVASQLALQRAAALEGEREELRGQHALLLTSVQEQHAAALRESLVTQEKALLEEFDERMRTMDADATKRLIECIQSQEFAAQKSLSALEMDIRMEAQQILKESLATQQLSLQATFNQTLQEKERAQTQEKLQAIRESVIAAEEVQRLQFKKAVTELRSHHAKEKAEFERLSFENDANHKQQIAKMEGKKIEIQQSMRKHEEESQKAKEEHQKEVCAFLEENEELRRHLAHSAYVAEKQANEHAAEQKRLNMLEAEAIAAASAICEMHKKEMDKLIGTNVQLKDAVQKLEIELIQQADDAAADRKKLEAAQQKIVANLTLELSQAQEKSAEIMVNAASRQSTEAKIIREQREEFDAILQSSLSERDSHYKMVIKQLEDNFTLDKKLLLNNQERAKVRYEEDLASHAAEYESVVRRQESSCKERMTKESAEAEVRHNAKLEAALEALTASHTKEIDLLRSSSLSNHEHIVNALQSTREKLEETKSLMAKQRTDFENYKAQQSDATEAELRAMDARHKAALANIEAGIQERETRLQAIHQQQCRYLNEESEAAILSAVAEERKLTQQKISQQKEIHRSEMQEMLTRESSWISERRALEAVHADLRVAIDDAKLAHTTLHNLQADHAVMSASMEQRLQDEKRRHTDCLSAITSQVDVSRANLERIHIAKIFSLEDDLIALRDAFAQQKRKFAIEIYELRRGHDVAMKEAGDLHTLNRQVALDDVAECHSRNLQEAITVLRYRLLADHSAATSKLEMEKKILEDRLRSTQNDTEIKLLDTEAALNALQKEMQMMQQKQAQNTAQYDIALAALTTSHDQELAAMHERSYMVVDQTVRDYEKKIRELVSKHDIMTSAMKAEIDQLASQKDSDVDNIEELTKDFALEKTALLSRIKEMDVHEDQVRILKTSNKELTRENSFLQSKFREIESELKASKKTELELNKQIEQARTRFAESCQTEVEQLSNSLRATEHKYQSQSSLLLNAENELNTVKTTLVDSERKYALLRKERDDIETSIDGQQNHLQGDYLFLLQKQTESLMAVVEAKSQQQSLPHIEG